MIASCLYLHSRAFAPAAEAGLNVRDPALAIKWPLPIGDISERDAARAFIAVISPEIST